MDNNTIKKQKLSLLLKEVEGILHAAVDQGISNNLNEYEMLSITFNTLLERNKKTLDNPPIKEDGVKSNVIKFKPKGV